MAWNEQETLAAAERATHLSELLAQEEFFNQHALRWLKRAHVTKFLAALDAVEAKRILRSASASFHYPSETNSRGFPLLDWLWVVDQSDDYRRQHIKTTDGAGRGRQLVARLAEHNYAWLARWWAWRCAKGRAYKLLPGCDYSVINALTKAEMESHFSALGEHTLAAIIGRKPDLIEALPEERRGYYLRLALEREPEVSSFVEVLSRLGIPSDASTVVTEALNDSDVTRQLNELAQKWQGPAGADPVAIAIKQGHERLEAQLRSPWRTVVNPTAQSRGDSNLWSAVLWGNVGPALASAVRVAPDRFRLELGYSIGLRIAEEATEPSPEKVGAQLKRFGIEPPTGVVDVLLPMAELWAALRTFAKYQDNYYQHDTELVGLRAKLVSLASAAPELWAQSLSWILARASKLGDVAQAITLELASSAPEVRAALEDVCNHNVEEVRLKAVGLRTLLLGLEDEESGLARTLADAAAHYMDGSPVFPHPLEPVSHTWLGSTGVERAIGAGVRRAAGRFADEVRDQGGDIEETLTKALLKELEVEFRAVRPRLKLLSSSRLRSPAPALSVRQRPTSKKSEEPIYGCDIALVLNATVRGRHTLTWVDLVQVKKSVALQQRRDKAALADSWEIKTKQLDKILRWSPTATYWLIAAAGEVLVLPAKHLLGIRRASRRGAYVETITVGYHQARSAAIPLEQYLVDLLIGQWVGTTAADTVRFALGEDTNIRPRIVLEVTITVGSDNH